MRGEYGTVSSQGKTQDYYYSSSQYKKDLYALYLSVLVLQYISALFSFTHSILHLLAFPYILSHSPYSIPASLASTKSQG